MPMFRWIRRGLTLFAAIGLLATIALPARRAAASGVATCASATTAFAQCYYNDFSLLIGTEWGYSGATPPYTAPNNQEKFLSAGTTPQHLQITNLPVHNEVRLKFDLYTITYWCGNDCVNAFQVKTPETTVFSRTFSTMAGYVQNYGPNAANPPFTWAAATNTLGYIKDATYHLEVVFPHSGGNLELDFVPPFDANAGIDNVRVEVRRAPPAITQQPGPENGTLGYNQLHNWYDATLQVAATGVGPLTYQWYRSGAPIEGATSASYALLVGPETEGWYYVVISDGTLSTQSRTTFVTYVPINGDCTCDPIN